MENTDKIRFRRKDEKGWRYALTVTNNGQILSSTSNPERAQLFTAKESDEVKYRAALENGIYKDVEVEVF